jgi:hypothetical protein
VSFEWVTAYDSAVKLFLHRKEHKSGIMRGNLEEQIDQLVQKLEEIV